MPRSSRLTKPRDQARGRRSCDSRALQPSRARPLPASSPGRQPGWQGGGRGHRSRSTRVAGRVSPGLTDARDRSGGRGAGRGGRSPRPRLLPSSPDRAAPGHPESCHHSRRLNCRHRRIVAMDHLRGRATDAHRLRSTIDAVVVGAGTVASTIPNSTARVDGVETQPRRSCWSEPSPSLDSEDLERQPLLVSAATTRQSRRRGRGGRRRRRVGPIRSKRRRRWPTRVTRRPGRRRRRLAGGVVEGWRGERGVIYLAGRMAGGRGHGLRWQRRLWKTIAANHDGVNIRDVRMVGPDLRIDVSERLACSPGSSSSGVSRLRGERQRGHATRAGRRDPSGDRPGSGFHRGQRCLPDRRRGQDPSRSHVDVVAETLRRSNLGRAATGDRVNLERPMAAHGRFDGHIVQGHVDGTGKITGVEPEGRGRRYAIAVPDGLTATWSRRARSPSMESASP